LRTDLQNILKVHEIERGMLPNFMFSETDLVVAIGIDGLVANTAKYLNGQPLVAVNPDPETIDGVLLPFNVSTAILAVRNVLRGQAKNQQITMAKVNLNDGQSLLAFNDFFIGIKSHISARYVIEVNGRRERQSSSGVVVSTGIGSTGWLSSMFNMANGILAGTRGEISDLLSPMRLDWNDERLAYVVREPFVSKTSKASIVFGYSTLTSPLIVHSEMPEGGVIFSDGIESDYLVFNSGMIATISVADKKTNLVVR